MNVLEKIEDKIKKFPQVFYEVKKGYLVIHPVSATGFKIEVFFSGTTTAVSFGNWHGHFKTENETIEFVGFGLSIFCRLREIRRGKSAYRWVIEQKVNNNWEECFTSGSRNLRFWLKTEEVIFQNTLITGKSEKSSVKQNEK